MTEAQSYYDGLMAQGYTPDQATEFTKQHFPEFGANQSPPDLSAPEPVPAMETPTQAAPAEVVGEEWRILMAESGLKLLLIKMVCMIVNVCTMFIAVPWTTVFYYNNWAGRVVLGGRKITFNGSAGGFFMVWLKTLGLSMITLSIYYWLVGRKNVARWVDSSIQWA